jgi:hypothetical protein
MLREGRVQGMVRPDGVSCGQLVPYRGREGLRLVVHLLVGQVLDRHRLPPGEPVAAADRENAGPALDHRPRHQVWLTAGQPVDEDVDLAPTQRAVRVSHRHFVNGQL